MSEIQEWMKRYRASYRAKDPEAKAEISRHIFRASMNIPTDVPASELLQAVGWLEKRGVCPKVCRLLLVMAADDDGKVAKSMAVFKLAAYMHLGIGGVKDDSMHDLWLAETCSSKACAK